tara:strand:- start:175 stop:360 length:186 start_codon:yes stop_codon:yes gene_type:complete
MIKNLLDSITDSATIGMGTTLSVSFVQYFELINPILSFVSLSIGIVIGAMTLWKKVKKFIK